MKKQILTMLAAGGCFTAAAAGTAPPPKVSELDPARRVSITAGANWIPLAVENGIEAGSPLDFSAIYPRDLPAGKHGRAVVRGSHFEFERLPGVPQRFYGVNLCDTANTPAATNAAALADFLMRTGYNAVRVHHHENALLAAGPDATALDPARLDRFDRLMAACIERGLYITTDLFVSRRIPYRACGIDKDGCFEMHETKIRALVNKPLRDNIKAFNRNLLTHVNPYTGRSYAQEDALCWISLVNEGNFWQFAGKWCVDKYPDWKAAWDAWAAARAAADPSFRAANADGSPRRDVYYRFFVETYRAFFAEMKTFLRDELRCRALLTDCNNANGPVGDQLVRHDLFDYVDDHFYVDHPEFIDKSWRLPSWCPNVNPVTRFNTGSDEGWWKNYWPFRRLYTQPFVITEYNFSGPGRFRGVGGISTAALAALQDWDGLWRFAWSHWDGGALGPRNRTFGYFDMANDPLSLAAERASICLFLRRDMDPLPAKYAFTLPRARLLGGDAGAGSNGVTNRWIAWRAQVGTVVADAVPAWARAGGIYPDVYRKTADDFAREIPPPAADAPSGVFTDNATGTLVIRSPRTCGAFTEHGRVEAGALAFDTDTAATIWASALDGAPLAASSRLLLTHLTDLQNTGITYADDSLQTLLNWGRPPHLVRRGTARITLRLAPGRACTVHSLDTAGRRRARVPSQTAPDGVLTFTAATARDPSNATLLYEIVLSE